MQPCAPAGKRDARSRGLGLAPRPVTPPLGEAAARVCYLSTCVLQRLFAWLFGRRPPPAAPLARGEDPPAPGEEGNEPDDAVVVVPVEASLDLHTFAPADLPSVVEEYLHEARAHGLREVRVIHGRGKGVARARVRRVLATHPAVEAFEDAPATRGGWGAQLVWLKPPRGR